MLCKPNTTVSTCILKKKALTASYDVVISHLKYSNWTQRMSTQSKKHNDAEESSIDYIEVYKHITKEQEALHSCCSWWLLILMFILMFIRQFSQRWLLAVVVFDLYEYY